MRRSRARPEDLIWLAASQYPTVRKARGTFAFHDPNGRKRKPIDSAIIKGRGITAGVADIIAIRKGHTFGLKLEAEEGKSTAKQIETIAAMVAASATLAITMGPDASISQLETWGILIGRAA